jgi:hypothetical protein
MTNAFDRPSLANPPRKRPRTNLPFLYLTHTPEWWAGAAALRREYARQALVRRDEEEARRHLIAATKYEETMKKLCANTEKPLPAIVDITA